MGVKNQKLVGVGRGEGENQKCSTDSSYISDSSDSSARPDRWDSSDCSDS